MATNQPHECLEIEEGGFEFSEADGAVQVLETNFREGEDGMFVFFKTSCIERGRGGEGRGGESNIYICTCTVRLINTTHI